MMARHVPEGISGPAALICAMTEHGYDGWHTQRIVSSHVAESEHVAAMSTCRVVPQSGIIWIRLCHPQSYRKYE